MYMVMTSNGQNGLDWICTNNTQEDAIKIAAEIEMTLKPDEIVCVVPLAYFKQK